MTQENGSGALKKRPRVDRSAPKPFKNAYLHFSNGKRSELAALYPEWSVQQQSAEIGRQWKALNQFERKPWIELAQFDKARFQTELEQYIDMKRANEAASGGANAGASKELMAKAAGATRIHIPFKRKKGRNEPKQPDTAYICFWRTKRLEVLNENPDMEAALVSKEVGRLWKSLSDEDRQIYKEMAAEDKVRYHQELAQYEQPRSEATGVANAKPMKDPYAPKAPKTGFQLFMSHNRESFTLLNMSINEFRVEMSRLWRRLGEEDKSVWYDLARQDQIRYETELNAYKPPAYMSTNLLRAQKRLEEFKKVAKSDSNAPRLPVSAYNCFLALKRREIHVQQPHLKHNEVMRQVGLTWKAMSSNEKVPFVRKAEHDIDRFEKEMQAYLGDHIARMSAAAALTERFPLDRQVSKTNVATGSTVKKRKLATLNTTEKKKKDPAVPRRPQTAYNLMYMSKRSEILAAYQMSHNECSALCGRMWRQMTDAERDPYHRMAVEDKVRYETEMREYRAKIEQAKEQESETRRRISRGFRYFLNAKRRESDHLSYEEISELWKAMSEPHQTLWEELAVDHALEEDPHGADELERLEETACVVLGASRDVHQSERNSLVNDEHSREEHDHQHDNTGARQKDLSGYRYDVDSKKSDQNRWSRAASAKDWESLAEPHQELWEELAAEQVVADEMEDERRQAASDLDALCGFVAGNGNPPVNAFV